MSHHEAIPDRISQLGFAYMHTERWDAYFMLEEDTHRVAAQLAYDAQEAADMVQKFRVIRLLILKCRPCRSTSRSGSGFDAAGVGRRQHCAHR